VDEKGTSGTLEKPQKPLSFLQIERKRISRESEEMKKIFLKDNDGKEVVK